MFATWKALTIKMRRMMSGQIAGAIRRPFRMHRRHGADLLQVPLKRSEFGRPWHALKLAAPRIKMQRLLLAGTFPDINMPDQVGMRRGPLPMAELLFQLS